MYGHIWRNLLLTPRKKVFKEPIVRVKAAGIHFPKVCPVCGNPARAKTRMTTIPNKKTWLRPSWDPAFTPSARRRFGISAPPSSTFLIPVCEEHVIEDESDCRYRTLCMICNGIVIAIAVFSLMSVGSDLWLGRGFSVWGYIAALLIITTMASTLLAFRARPLEASVKIVGFDYAAQYVWIAFRDPEYRRRFLEENEMNAELVRWIVRA
jgi:hypothetical protein